MITFTDEQAIAIFDSLQDDNTYSPQDIFSQVWEAPYSWFRLTSDTADLEKATVAEVSESGEVILDHQWITEDQIKRAAIRNYFNIWFDVEGKFSRTLYSYLVDLDANDVDAILQLAMFGEIRYG